MLGTASGQPLTVKTLAERTKVPSSYLSKVLQALGRAGLVHAQRGLNGGFTMARPLDELTVLDVINAVDPLKRITRCPLGLSRHQLRLCPLHRRIDAGIALVESHFRETTIAELIEESSPRLPLCQDTATVSIRPRG
jgi:Rrf2 family protein